MTESRESKTQAEATASAAEIRPLMGRDSDGNLYKRSEEVERQIREALDLGTDELIERIRIRDYEAPEYLQEECIVYLIREFALQSGPRARQMVSKLSEGLIGRFAKHLNDRLGGLSKKSDRDEAFNAVVAKLFDEIADLDSDRGDFFQVRFWVRLGHFAIDEFRKRSDFIKLRQKHDSLEELAQYEESDDEITTNDPLKDEQAISPENRASWEDLESRALAQIGEPHRTAYILRYKMEWLTETEKEDEPITISEYFDVTPRTVRRWLKKAEEELKAWKEKHPQEEERGKT